MTRESKAIEVLMNWAEDRVSPEGVSKDDMVEKAFRAGPLKSFAYLNIIIAIATRAATI